MYDVYIVSFFMCGAMYLLVVSDIYYEHRTEWTKC